MGLLSWLFDDPAPTMRRDPSYPTISLEEAKRLSAQWSRERMDNFEAAIAAIPEEPPFRVKQGDDGWWRVERPSIDSDRASRWDSTNHLRWMEPIYAGWWDESAHKFETEVRVWRVWQPFAPTFLTRLEAEQWLAEHIAAVEADATSIPYNADGTRVGESV